MTAPDWLSARDGGLAKGINGRSVLVTVNGEPMWRLDALPRRASSPAPCCKPTTADGWTGERNTQRRRPPGPAGWTSCGRSWAGEPAGPGRRFSAQGCHLMFKVATHWQP